MTAIPLPFSRVPRAATPDAVIVGGGLGGSGLAITLRRLGMEVALVERTTEFHDRIRGETIHPWGAREIRELGLEDIAIDAAGALPQRHWLTYRDRQPGIPYTWSSDFPDAPYGLSVRHSVFQRALLDTAISEGVRVFRPAEVRLSRSPGGVTASIESDAARTDLSPRFVFGADGQSSATRSWIGGSGRRDSVHHAIGGALIDGLDLANDRVHQAFVPGGFAMITPQTGGTSRVYLICSSEEASRIQRAPDSATPFMERVAEGLPEGIVGEWRSSGPIGFFPNANVVATYPVIPDVIPIGDAAGANDPCQGHGISLTFHDVRVLRDLFRDGLPDAEISGAFAAKRRGYFEVLRQHAHWTERQATETGPEIEAVRERIARARELDPSAGGFSGVFATGPDGLVADEAARRHFFGEDLPLEPASRLPELMSAD
ncbi:MAG: FAD-dependent monooxygenase [Chloroflexia bacterium]|nr:FAD-dependent monooxygenase [Chloroflexia bacterium]